MVSSWIYEGECRGIPGNRVGYGVIQGNELKCKEKHDKKGCVYRGNGIRLK